MEFPNGCHTTNWPIKNKFIWSSCRNAAQHVCFIRSSFPLLSIRRDMFPVCMRVLDKLTRQKMLKIRTHSLGLMRMGKRTKALVWSPTCVVWFSWKNAQMASEREREEKQAQNKMNEKYLVVFAFLLPLKTLYDTHQCGWDSVAFFYYFPFHVRWWTVA